MKAVKAGRGTGYNSAMYFLAAECQRRAILIASVLAINLNRGDRQPIHCARVLRHALRASRLWDRRLNKDQSIPFHGEFRDFPLVKLWYDSLIRMTTEQAEKRVLNGFGNLETPAGPYFTACELTNLGRQAAVTHLRRFPRCSDVNSLRQRGGFQY